MKSRPDRRRIRRQAALARFQILSQSEWALRLSRGRSRIEGDTYEMYVARKELERASLLQN
jgi:hypothetical protein